MVTLSQSFHNPRSFKKIEEEAVEHDLDVRWEEAVEVNLQGIETDDRNTACLNRLAKAYLELSKYKDAL